ncbi:hypothetical protein BVRB_5g105070 [Beta vulgaris subsp. vulgaris]|nr:hypothetical protein BVRB_5g105070 [Beta vulgaris subsp. vulgaris]
MAKSLKLNTNIIECVYSTTTREMTEPRVSYKISFPDSQSLNNNNDHTNKNLQNRMHIILCYKKQSSNEDSGLHVGGWIKQSLGNALMEHPIAAGRIRRSENGGLEILSNDSGVRCVEARVSLSLVEFLQFQEKNDVETKLVYWNHVDETNPLFSPLFYVQVTNFQCGGYSIGISFSLLLADPLFMAKFLNSWAKIHRSMANENEVPRTSFFHSPDFNMMGCSSLESATSSISNISKKIPKTMIFNISTSEKLDSKDEMCKYFVQLCLEEAAKSKFGSNMISTFTLITKEPNGDVKVENLSKQDISESQKWKYELSSLTWEDLGINEVAFHKGIELVDASYWIASDALEGMVLVVISLLGEGKSGFKIYITVSSD